jgi:hypothetical protein
MATTQTQLPGPEELEVLGSVITYGPSEFEAVVLDRLKAIAADDDQQRLTDEEAGRLFRAAFDAIRWGKSLHERGEEALALLNELSWKEGFADKEEHRAYLAGMRAWFLERADIYEPDEGDKGGQA